MVVNDCGSQASSRVVGGADRGWRLVMHDSGRHGDGEGSAVDGGSGWCCFPAAR